MLLYNSDQWNIKKELKKVSRKFLANCKNKLTIADLCGPQIAEAQIAGLYCAYLKVKRIIEKVVHLEAKPSIKILLADCQHSTVAIFGRPCADDLNIYHLFFPYTEKATAVYWRRFFILRYALCNHTWCEKYIGD